MHEPNQDLKILKFSCLYLFPFAHKVVSKFVPYFGPYFRAFQALRALKGPQIKFSLILMHQPYQDIQNLKLSCLYPFPFSHKVVSRKASSRGRVVYHTSTGQYKGVATNVNVNVISRTALIRNRVSRRVCM